MHSDLSEIFNRTDFIQKIHSYSDIMIVMDPDGIIKDYNILDYEKDKPVIPEIPGMNIRDLFDSETGQRITSAINQTGKDNPVSELEYVITVNSVNRIYWAKIFTASGYLVIMYLKDITRIKRAEEALIQTELRFRSIWENSIDGMRLLDMNGNIVAANKAYSDLTGINSGEYLGKPFTYVYSEKNGGHFPESLDEYRRRFSQRSFPLSFESEVEFRSGKCSSVEVSNVFIESGEGLEAEVLLLSIFRDVTARKKAEEDLRKNEKLAAIGRMAAYLSHEIKTPLASIRMNIDMIFKDNSLSRQKQKSLEIIQREIKRLNKMLRNVLQYSRNYELIIVNINLHSMIKNIKNLLEPQLIEKHIEFSNDVGDVRINGDYQKLQSVFLHLIENSIDAVDNNGKISVYAEENDEDDYVRIFIRDDGTGIESGDQIFEPFYTNKNTGTGLGLAIAQRIVELHNGEIKLLSSRNGETIFVIKLYNYGI
jgi:PAS domain S-box-containing protein